MFGTFELSRTIGEINCQNVIANFNKRLYICGVAKGIVFRIYIIVTLKLWKKKTEKGVIEKNPYNTELSIFGL